MNRSCACGLIVTALLLAWMEAISADSPVGDSHPIKLNFCRMYADCRSTARQQFEKCTGGNVVAMILAKNGALPTITPNTSDRNETFLANDNKCMQRLDEVVGARMRELYENSDRRTRRCSNELSNTTTFKLDEAATLLCHAISTEVVGLSATELAQLRLAVSDDQPMQTANPYGAESERDCALVHAAELRRCELAASCCPQYAGCRRQADVGSGMYVREMIVARSFDDCLQKSALAEQLKAASNKTDNEPVDIPVNYSEIRARLSTAAIADVPNVREMIAAVMADTASVLSLHDVHPRIRTGVYERLMRLRALRKKAEAELADVRFHPGRTTTTTTTTIKPTTITTEPPTLPTLLPPPDKALKQLVDLLFPGLKSTTTVLPTTTTEVPKSTTSTSLALANSSSVTPTISTVATTVGSTAADKPKAELTVHIENASKSVTVDSDSKAGASAVNDDSDAAAAVLDAATRQERRRRVELSEQAKREKAKENAKERKVDEDLLAIKDGENEKKATKKHEIDAKADKKEKNAEKEKEDKGKNKKEKPEKEAEDEKAKQSEYDKAEKKKKQKSETGKENMIDGKKKSKKDEAPPSPWSIHGASPPLADTVAEAESDENENVAEDAPPADTAAEHVFCTQYFECREVLHDQYNSCEDRHLEGDKKHGISDRLLRGIFEENVGVDDAQIQRRCFEAIDAGSQSQLVALRDKIKNEIRDCTCKSQKTATNRLTAKKVRSCESIKLLSALSSAMKLDHDSEAAGRGGARLRRCNERLAHLERKCNELRDCCPAHVKCEQLNDSENAQKYVEIVGQLKQEQNLCERRHLRLRNGLM